MEEHNYTVYMHVCPNDKKYIGITKLGIKKRAGNNGNYYKKCIYFYNAIQKYGWENIKHEILFTNLTKEEAEEKEIQLISYYKSNQQEYGYNIANGGNCTGTLSKKTKEKISKNNSRFWLDKKLSDETRKKLSVSHKGLKLSQETKQKLSKIHKGKQTWNKNKKGYCGIKIKCIETDIIYNSIGEAAYLTKINKSHICACCKNKYGRKTAGGYHWQYYKNESEDK